MRKSAGIYNITTCVTLCIIGILIPLYSPIKIILEPAAFTLASHVVIFLAMFISPIVALAVAISAAAGTFFAGVPEVIVLRAATHLAFAQFGALYLSERPQTLDKRSSAFIFSFLIACLHAFCEIVVVIPFYFGNGINEAFYAQGFLKSVVLLVGAGTVAHSMLDFEIALFIRKLLKKNKKFQSYQGE